MIHKPWTKVFYKYLAEHLIVGSFGGVVTGVSIVLFRKYFPIQSITEILIATLFGHAVSNFVFPGPVYRRTNRAVIVPPGYLLSRIGHFIFTRKTYERELAPLLADFRFEYFEALKGGDRTRALYLRFLYAFLFFKTAGFESVLKVSAGILRNLIGK